MSADPQDRFAPLLPPGPEINDPIDRANVAALSLATMTDALYRIIIDPTANWTAGSPKGDLERLVEVLLDECISACHPLLPWLQRLRSPAGINGWDRWETCAVLALFTFTRRTLAEAARRRGEKAANDFGFLRFEELPAPAPNWCTGLVQQEFALLRTSGLEGAPGVNGKQEEPPPQYVTLDQIAAIVRRGKRTLERRIKDGTMPFPDLEGGGGRPNEWRWDRVRLWLRDAFGNGRELPERFPGPLS
jgi:hypothetical protein